MFYSENEFTVTSLFKNQEKSINKEKKVTKIISEINENNYVYEPTSFLIDKKIEDLSKNRLLVYSGERRNLRKKKTFDVVVAEKLTTQKILEEQILNNTNREPVVVVSISPFFV